MTVSILKSFRKVSIPKNECWVSSRVYKREQNHSLRTFCEKADSLGIKFLVEKERSVFERLFWAVCLVLSLILCQVLILQGWTRWRWSTIITRNSITELSFPAITICPEMKFNAEEIDYEELQHSLRMKNISEERATLIQGLSLVCPYPFFLLHSFIGIKLPSDVTHIIEKYAMRPEQFINNLVWGTLIYGRDLKEIITEEGLCFTFNSLPGNRIFRENTFHSNRNYLNFNITTENQFFGSKNNGYPFKIIGPSRLAGLWIALNDAREKNICRLNNGYMITVHNPADVPRPSQRGVRVPHSSIGEVVVTPESLTTSSDVKRLYSPAERQCLYPDERYLRFFKQYTQVNCELECLANYTLRLCGCVGFYMPRNLTTPVCSIYAAACMDAADWIMRQIDAKKGMNKRRDDIFSEMTEEEIREMKCNCLQVCDRLDYKVRVSHVPLLQKSIENRGIWSALSIYFDDSYYIPGRRRELYGTVEFIANCGGILGFIMGLSILSLIELLCCLLIRPSFVKYCRRHPRMSESLPTMRHFTTIHKQP